MLLRKYRLLITIAFMGIFAIKMVISGAPVIFTHLDRSLMNAVIMQLEVENNGDETQKVSLKLVECKQMFQRFDLTYIPIEIDYGVSNSFIEHSRRYVDPHHPSVPTPPPNFS
ncbi:hypothetical protein [Pedobacter cryotolerans]|uniref:Uncharacterized protein n=1 Tax=Pedobacter cryotolerans TaxID=2571270 RepID=A0A4U1C2J3_9SPHI|nr:hypothetical protein [Pedobacter cryotolerans]TKB98210.1 hypothetical protein FA045_14605 [Pedobacter cryotolerans]